MSINKILKISIMILFAFVFTDIALSSCPECNPPIIISPGDNDVILAGSTFLCVATGDPVITWSGPGSFSPSTGSSVYWTAPVTTGNATITATNSCGSDQVTVRIADIIFVDEDATGNDDGTSWTDAYNYLQDGLDDASSSNHIWVAEGTYYPDEGDTPTDDDRTETFQLVEDVEVYGGFDPTIGDDLWAERDYITNVTILSGDIDQDAGPGPDADDSYHVVTGADNATIDGFTITGGYANGSGGNSYGAGMFNYYTSPTVKNCSFIYNDCLSVNYSCGGGGIYNGYSNATITGCTFYNNRVAKVWRPNPAYIGNGAAMLNVGDPAPTITNCVFSTNYANTNGGAIDNASCDPIITNCVFVMNDAYSSGGGINNSYSEPIITNCTFTGNSAKTGGGMFNWSNSDPIVTNCIFWENTASINGGEICNWHEASDPDFSYCDIEGGINGTKCYGYDSIDGGGNIDADPKFFDTDDIDGPDDLFMTLDDGLEIGFDSPCLDTGNNTPVTDSYDIIGRTRIIDGDEDTTATVDMGAYEFQPAAKGPYLIFTGTNTEMMVLWQLNQDRTCTIEWGTSTSYGSSSQVDDDVSYPGQYLYRHTITGLTVGTKYYYRVLGVGSGTFYSAPASNATAVNFLAYGDSRGEDDGAVAPNFDNVCAKMNDTFTTDSDYQTFTLHAGDYIYTGGNETHWTNQYFNRTDDDIMDLQANLPMQGSLGNHETYSGGTAIYRKYFPYYDLYMSNTYGCGSFDYGPVHIVVIDGYIDDSSYLTAQQIQWIEDDLDNTTKEWKFLLFHAPGYSAGGGHGNNTNVQDDIQPLCVTYGVDIVFNGHNHYYSRAVVNGVYHVTTGGGGALLSNPDDTYPYIDVVDKSHHFCKISIDGDDLNFVALDISDNTIDSFQINH